MDRGTWRATVHGVTKSQPRLSISAAPQKVTELPYDLAIPHLGYTSKELKAGLKETHPCRSSIIDNNQKNANNPRVQQ